MAIGEGISDEEVFAAIKRNLEDTKELWDEVFFKIFLIFVLFYRKEYSVTYVVLGKNLQMLNII